MAAAAQPVPRGLERLANIWTAPFPGYAPAFIRTRSFGYFLSAVFGVGVLLLGTLLAKSCCTPAADVGVAFMRQRLVSEQYPAGIQQRA